MALAQDNATGAGRGRVVDSRRGKEGLVIYQSDFDHGFDGWTDHWGGFRPMPIVSLTDEIQNSGKRSLMLSTGEEANPIAGDPASAPAVFKRLTRHDEYRYHTFSGWFAVGVGGFDGTWQAFQLIFDTQKWDNSGRSFFKLQCTNAVSPNVSRWQIRNNAGGENYINVPGSFDLFAGQNENKLNMTYVRLTVDLQANAGTGGYQSMQVGPKVIDLSGLGGGGAFEPPQASSFEIDDFRGGHNLGLYVARNQTATGGCQLFADDLTYSCSNTA